jgi:hypothetical protein
LDSPQLVFTACLEPTGVVENISLMVREDEFILNIVNATLLTEFSSSAFADKNIRIQPLKWVRV